MNIKEYYMELCDGLKRKSYIQDLCWLFKSRFSDIDINEWTMHTVTTVDANELALGLQRIINEEPLSYIIGKSDFFWCEIGVNKSVLIPRPETEQLCDIVVREIPKDARVLDLCTGSGCIAIALKKSKQDLQIDAVDVSPEAIQVAKDNAKRNSVDINFIESDMWQNIKNKYDVIVSNPPYLDSNEMANLPKSVGEYEPHLALFGGEDGLDFYRNIAEVSPQYLNPNARLFLEVGDKQAKQVAKLLRKNFTEIKIRKDLFGKKRYVFARRK